MEVVFDKTEIVKRIIVALDFPCMEDLKNFVEGFYTTDDELLKPDYVKVGMELFYAEGSKVIDYLKSRDLKIFLDLKVHDIPNTCYGAIKSLSKLGVNMINVHALGGLDMMRAARRALDESGSDAKLIAVTHLTSMDEASINTELGVLGSIDDAILRLASNAYKAGMDGVVCSPLESAKIKAEFGDGFMTVTPGVRFASGVAHDQKRISTPAEAIAAGSDFIVMGRSITQADSWQTVFAQI